MEAINKGYETNFIQSPYIIGNSSLPFGLRSNVIKGRENLKTEENMKMLSGSMSHRNFQKSKVMYEITKMINTSLGYTEIEVNGNRFIELENGNYIKFTVEKEVELFIEITPGRYLRMHIDMRGFPFYCIEMKFTTLPKKMWKELAPYQIMQLNTYMGFSHTPFGYLLKGDLSFYKSASKRWSYVWNKYFMLYYHKFNQELFDYAIDKTKAYFHYIDNEIKVEKISCPEFLFECDDECKEYCPNPIEKVPMDHNDTCFYCKGLIEMGTKAITRNGNIYHYTNDKGHPFEACVKACREAWEIKENE